MSTNWAMHQRLLTSINAPTTLQQMPKTEYGLAHAVWHRYTFFQMYGTTWHVFQCDLHVLNCWEGDFNNLSTTELSNHAFCLVSFSKQWRRKDRGVCPTIRKNAVKLFCIVFISIHNCTHSTMTTLITAKMIWIVTNILMHNLNTSISTLGYVAEMTTFQWIQVSSQWYSEVRSPILRFFETGSFCWMSKRYASNPFDPTTCLTTSKPVWRRREDSMPYRKRLPFTVRKIRRTNDFWRVCPHLLHIISELCVNGCHVRLKSPWPFFPSSYLILPWGIVKNGRLWQKLPPRFVVPTWTHRGLCCLHILGFMSMPPNATPTAVGEPVGDPPAKRFWETSLMTRCRKN